MPTTLMHAPHTCSLAVRFAAAEGDVPLAIRTLNLSTKDFDDGGSLYDINPLGQVSTLQFETGDILTETSTCLMWVQSQSTKSGFHIAPDHPSYFQLLRWLAFTATELHKQIFRVVFYPEATDEVKDRIRGLAPERFQLLDSHLANSAYLLGDHFTAADAYLTWFFVLAERAGVSPADGEVYPHLTAYQDKVLTRPLIAPLIKDDIQLKARSC